MPDRPPARTGSRLRGGVIAALACLLPLVGPASSQGTSMPDEAETIIGTHAGPGATCPQFEIDGAGTVSLSGDVLDLLEGQSYRLTGIWPPRTKCMQGREFRVLSYQNIDE